MSDWIKGSLLLAATLSAGIAIGIWYDGGAMQHRTVQEMHSTHEHAMHLLDESLNLDSAQHIAVMQTLHRHQSFVDSAWQQLRPHVSATLDSTHAEIMKLLTPAQRERFSHMVQQVHGAGGVHHR